MKLTEENADGMDCRPPVEKTSINISGLRERIARDVAAARKAKAAQPALEPNKPPTT